MAGFTARWRKLAELVNKAVALVKPFTCVSPGHCGNDASKQAEVDPPSTIIGLTGVS